MDQRFDARYPAGHDVVVTDLNAPSSPHRGTITDISRSGVCLVSPAQLKHGAVVRLEFADSSLFGYVAYSNPEGTTFRTGIEVQRVLMGGTDLSQLLRGILQQEMPLVPGLEVAVR